MKLQHLALAALTTLLSTPSADAAEQPTLWSIGKSDNNTAEFALAPGNYGGYKKPAFFTIGKSDPKKDWPYIQPGTVGGWVPGDPQKNTVWFALKSVAEGASTLVLDINDTHNHYPPKLEVTINGVKTIHITKRGADSYGDPTKGIEQVITVPVSTGVLIEGINNVSITTLNGAWLSWDSVSFQSAKGTELGDIANYTATIVDEVNAINAALLWQDGKKVQNVSIKMTHFGKPIKATVTVGNVTKTIELVNGTQEIGVGVTPVKKESTVPVIVKVGGKELSKSEVTFIPVKEMEIHIVHQTHLDIGFTHTQADVLALQVKHLRTAMKLIKKTKDYPEGARFIFHPEGMWQVEEFMRIASEQEKKEFIIACQNKQIHLDVLYAQAMTGMYTDEELFELMGTAKRFEKKHKVEISSAMQSDVPGYTWGLAAALAHHDVKHLSVGPNWFSTAGGNAWYDKDHIAGRTHRGGRVFEWGDKPFYWVSPSGKDKILFWMPGWGYCGFLSGRHVITEEKTFAYLDWLKTKDYQYDMVYWRYGQGADNGPPVANLPDVVKAWNEKFASPRMIITTNSAALETLEKRYADVIPVVSGDFTPYWEDGAASTADATGVNRKASERASQAQTIWSMKNPSAKLHEQAYTAWHKMIMYDEHTWGANCSASAPDSAFAVSQDEYKQAYARDGYKLTNKLVEEAASMELGSSTLDIYNTASYTETSVVKLSKEQSKAGDRVVDASGEPVPSQRLASGELAFLAKDVPALGASRFTVTEGKAFSKGSAVVKGLSIKNDKVALTIDKKTGNVTTFTIDGSDKNFVDNKAGRGLNDYLYILGRDADKGRSVITGDVKITVEDAGPLVATLKVESSAPGCKSLVRRVQVASGQDFARMSNTMDKLRQTSPEGVYFGFPFDLPGATSIIDVPWATVEVEKEQLLGANRNFYCVQRWVDMANKDHGVTWATIDAPLVQFDPIKIAHAFGTQFFRTKFNPGSHIWSWTLNNHWEVNYKAYQKGLITFDYAIRPYSGGYNSVASQKFGRKVCQPLIAVATDKSKAVAKSLLTLEGDDGVIVTTVRPSADGKAFMVRLFNTASKDQTVSIKLNRPSGKIQISNPMEDIKGEAPKKISLVRHEIITLRVERKNQ